MDREGIAYDPGEGRRASGHRGRLQGIGTPAGTHRGGRARRPALDGLSAERDHEAQSPGGRRCRSGRAVTARAGSSLTAWQWSPFRNSTSSPLAPRKHGGRQSQRQTPRQQPKLTKSHEAHHDSLNNGRHATPRPRSQNGSRSPGPVGSFPVGGQIDGFPQPAARGQVLGWCPAKLQDSSGLVEGLPDNGTARGARTLLSPDSVNR